MTAPRPGPALAGAPALSVWPTAQQDARAQRRGRYLPESTAHPGKMLPAIAATAIARYTRPGDLVADPMCGIGTTLAEAVRQGHDGLGIEYEDRWATIAAANVARARQLGATGTAEIIRGDARQLTSLIPAALTGTAALVMTSPPYGASVHGQVTAERRNGQRGGVRKYDSRYGRDPGNLASRRLDELLDGFTQILAGCAVLLRPRHGGGHRPPLAAARRTGRPARRRHRHRRPGRPDPRRPARRPARRAPRREPHRPSRVLPARQHPPRPTARPAWHLIVHEDVLIFQRPSFPGSPAAALPQPAHEAQHRDARPEASSRSRRPSPSDC